MGLQCVNTVLFSSPLSLQSCIGLSASRAALILMHQQAAPSFSPTWEMQWASA